MADLYELITRRHDELRGRPENWRDRLGYRLRVTDWQDVLFLTILWTHGVVLVAAEAALAYVIVVHPVMKFW